MASAPPLQDGKSEGTTLLSTDDADERRSIKKLYRTGTFYASSKCEALSPRNEFFLACLFICVICGQIPRPVLFRTEAEGVGLALPGRGCLHFTEGNRCQISFPSLEPSNLVSIGLGLAGLAGYAGWISARFAVNGGVEECRNSWSRLSKRPDSSRKGIKKPSPQSSSRRSSRSGGGGNCSHSRSRPTFSRAWRMRLWPRSERAVQVSSTSKSYELVSDAAVLGAVRGLARACSPAGPASLRVVPARSSGDTIRSSGDTILNFSELGMLSLRQQGT